MNHISFMYKYLFKNPTCKPEHKFKMKHDFNTRKSESTKILSDDKLKGKLPVIVEKSSNCPLPDLASSQFIVKKELTVGSLLYILRKNANISETDGVFLFVDNKHLPRMSDNIGTIYEKYKDPDGFLYFTYCTENVFG